MPLAVQSCIRRSDPKRTEPERQEDKQNGRRGHRGTGQRGQKVLNTDYVSCRVSCNSCNLIQRQVSNKTCYALLFLAALACVVVGLIVFYVTNMECQAELEELEKNEGGGDDVKGKPLKQKVK